jgi:hypothetical protein
VSKMVSVVREDTPNEPQNCVHDPESRHLHARASGEPDIDVCLDCGILLYSRYGHDSVICLPDEEHDHKFGCLDCEYGTDYMKGFAMVDCSGSYS